MKSERVHPASFRDRSGFIFSRDGQIFRHINPSYQNEYDHLIDSGLYRTLTSKKLLIPHQEIETQRIKSESSYRILKPETIRFISYPYEWSFSQLKDAALLTLNIQNLALDAGMSLKDASAFNIQFHEGQPLLIDTLSFEIYQEGEPWVAYRQFCQHFLAPLALMALVDIRLQKLLTYYIDGIPVDLASRLLPFRSRFKLGLLTNIHLHAASQRRVADHVLDRATAKGSVSLTAMRGLVDSLRRTVEHIDWKPVGTEWADYYSASQNYTDASLKHKHSIVKAVIEDMKPGEVWDLGANTGMFSSIATDRSIPTLSFDIDPGAVEINYLQSKASGDKWRLPLLLDLTNPTPAIGWNNTERQAMLERGPAEFVLALALIHHLAISNNVPMESLASFFAGFAQFILIEFVPKSDPQVQRLLAFREDIFKDYNPESFKASFEKYFKILRVEKIVDSERTLYLLENRSRSLVQSEVAHSAG